MPCKNNEQKFRTIVTFGTQRTYKPLTISSKYQIDKILRNHDCHKTIKNNGNSWYTRNKMDNDRVQLEHIHQLPCSNNKRNFRTMVTFGT